MGHHLLGNKPNSTRNELEKSELISLSFFLENSNVFLMFSSTFMRQVFTQAFLA